jgi:hypothetical protein
MRKHLAVATLLLPIVTCGPGADVRGFPNAWATTLCHFYYHCCTPADRLAAPFPGGATTFTGEAASLEFDDEGSCDTKLGIERQNEAQPYEASVQDKRMAFNQQNAQSCLNAVNAAANKCDIAALLSAADLPDAGCANSDLYTGLSGAGGPCTSTADCAAPGATCDFPQPDGGGLVVSSIGACNNPPGTGQPCATGGRMPCAVGNCCMGGTCTAYAAVGSACNGSFCGAQACDPSQAYCPTTGNATCTALVANGGSCTQGFQCQSRRCIGGTCQGNTVGPQPQYQICTGNPDNL